MRCYSLTEFGAPLVAEERPTPRPRDDEALLRVTAAGVCHSDIHLWEGSYNVGHGNKMLLNERGINLPLVLGHETVGEVVALGPDAQGVAIGRTYLVYPWIGCGACAACSEGDENLCGKPRSLGVYRDGGYADHILVPRARYLLDIEGIDAAVAAPYACSGVTTYSALKKVRSAMATSPVVIIGAGGLGLMALNLVTAMGGIGAIIVDIDERKRAAAREAGALATVDGAAPDAVKQIVRAAGGPPRAIVDLVGSEATAEISFAAVARGGKIVIVGLFGGAARWPLPLIPIKAVTIQGSYVGNLADLTELLELCKSGKVATIPLTRCKLDDADRMLQELRAGRVVGRAVLTPG